MYMNHPVQFYNLQFSTIFRVPVSDRHCCDENDKNKKKTNRTKFPTTRGAKSLAAWPVPACEGRARFSSEKNNNRPGLCQNGQEQTQRSKLTLVTKFELARIHSSALWPPSRSSPSPSHCPPFYFFRKGMQKGRKDPGRAIRPTPTNDVPFLRGNLPHKNLARAWGGWGF